MTPGWKGATPEGPSQWPSVRRKKRSPVVGQTAAFRLTATNADILFATRPLTD